MKLNLSKLYAENITNYSFDVGLNKIFNENFSLGFVINNLSSNFSSSIDGSDLYSDSPLIENERVHVATFDGYNDLEYNSGNCEISADLRMEAATSEIKYWCEEGYFRK